MKKNLDNLIDNGKAVVDGVSHRREYLLPYGHDPVKDSMSEYRIWVSDVRGFFGDNTPEELFAEDISSDFVGGFITDNFSYSTDGVIFSSPKDLRRSTNEFLKLIRRQIDYREEYKKQDEATKSDLRVRLVVRSYGGVEGKTDPIVWIVLDDNFDTPIRKDSSKNKSVFDLFMLARPRSSKKKYSIGNMKTINTDFFKIREVELYLKQPRLKKPTLVKKEQSFMRLVPGIVTIEMLSQVPQEHHTKYA